MTDWIVSSIQEESDVEKPLIKLEFLFLKADRFLSGWVSARVENYLIKSESDAGLVWASNCLLGS